jgi:hypothetical protein
MIIDLNDEDMVEFISEKFLKSDEHKEFLSEIADYHASQQLKNGLDLQEELKNLGMHAKLWHKGSIVRVYIYGFYYISIQPTTGEAVLEESFGMDRRDKAIIQKAIGLYAIKRDTSEIVKALYLKNFDKFVKNNRHKVIGDTSVLWYSENEMSSFKGRTAFTSLEKSYGGYSTHSFPTRNAEEMWGEEMWGEEMWGEEMERDVPKYVLEKAEYFEKEKGYPTSYAFAMAWSIWCKYKDPESRHCQRGGAKEYLLNQGKKRKASRRFYS